MKQRGFTLLEVMLALALLGFGLVVLMKSAAGNIASSEEAHMMGIATDLARGKMYDIEEVLLKDGFTDTDQSQTGEQCFEDEGWPTVCYTYKVEEPKLPSFDELQAMAEGQAKAAMGSGMGSGVGGFGSG
ncbi:MAG TPA: prepilin-type N-terminal cleavage/methylation domain-containing protein, partial [Kofleriaceae bacterium]|nr:prepilin-type N-terminal cleavage/methylation domain-containing protein [Kofleriaceae bacterium]